MMTDLETASPALELGEVKRSTFFDAFQRFPVGWFANLLVYRPAVASGKTGGICPSLTPGSFCFWSQTGTKTGSIHCAYLTLFQQATWRMVIHDASPTPAGITRPRTWHAASLN